MQFPEYFKGYENEIKDMYKPFIGKKVKNRLGIHLRLGDYVSPTSEKVFNVLSTEDINKCLKIFNKKFNDIIVFTNDIEKAKTIIPDSLGVVYDESENEIELMQKMSGCEYFIASNSTFSWWACYLGEIQNVCVYYPWLKIANQDALYLPHWKKFNLIDS